MEVQSIEQLGRELLQCQAELSSICQQGLNEQNSAAVAGTMVKYLKLKREIRTAFLKEENSVVSIPNPEVRNLVRRVLRNEKTAADEFCREIFEQAPSEFDIESHLSGQPVFQDEPEPIPLLNDDWIDEAGYLSGLFEIGALVLDFDPLPSFLRDYVSQARRCYGHGFYLAVISLSRVILEICLRDYRRRTLEESRRAPMPESEANGGSLFELIDEVFDRDKDRRAAHRVRIRMNKVAHGSFYGSDITREDAYQVFADTIHLVHLLYEQAHNQQQEREQDS